jgi:YggT family protein
VTAYILIRVINGLCMVLEFLLAARAIMSWFAQNPYSQAGKIYRVLIDLTEWMLRPCRNLISRFVNTGMFDFSIILAFFLMDIVRRVLIRLIYILLL